MKRGPTLVVRDELVRVRAQRACDRRAEIAGLLRTAGAFHILGERGFGFEASSEHPGVARRIFEAVAGGLHARGEVRLIEPGRGHPSRRYAVHADGLSLQRLVEAGILDERGAPGAGVPRRLVAKRCCAAAYLRGAFLARGSVSDPRAGAHLEFRADSDAAAEDVRDLLAQVGVRARVRRHRGVAVYVKGNEAVGTALAALGAHEAYLAWEEGAIWKTVHVEAARMANADAGNAKRQARAVAQHLRAIDAIESTRGLEAMPVALAEVARVRREHPEATLEELGTLCRPPVSKAAVADRLRRLVRLAGSAILTV